MPGSTTRFGLTQVLAIMCQEANASIPVIAAMASGLFALFGGFAGAALTRRTEYEKWLRQERSTAFADFLRQIHDVRTKAVDLIYAIHDGESSDAQITELFTGLKSQEGIVRLYLNPGDRDRFSELTHELWVIHGASTSQQHRLARSEAILKELQSIFEITVRG